MVQASESRSQTVSPGCAEVEFQYLYFDGCNKLAEAIKRVAINRNWRESLATEQPTDRVTVRQRFTLGEDRSPSMRIDSDSLTHAVSALLKEVGRITFDRMSISVQTRIDYQVELQGGEVAA